MASALELTATAYIVNGQGLATNYDILSQISVFQNQPTISLLSNVFTNASTLNSNVADAVLPILTTIATGATQGQYLIDLYPDTVTPACTANIPKYGGVLESVSGAINAQAQGPFTNGLSGFANLFMNCHGYAFQVFDTVASIHMLKDKTYHQSGLGFTSKVDLATGGVGQHGALLADVVENWGTMYDVTNLNLIGDVYVFGQNLLNQGFGSYGDLDTKLIAAGLDITDITKIPATTTVTTTVEGILTTSTSAGPINFPIITNVPNTNTVTGNSRDVILAIYNSITGDNLAAIVTATGFVSTIQQLTTLADYINFNKVVEVGYRTQLNALGINNFTNLGQYLHSRIGQGSFATWNSLATSLRNIEVPTTEFTTVTTGASKLLSANTVSTLLAVTGTGNGSLKNPIISDYLGACAGMPYSSLFNTVNTNYKSFIAPVETAMQNLDLAILQTINDYVGSGNVGPVDTTYVAANVVAVQSALNSLSPSDIAETQLAFEGMITRLVTEVTNIFKAGGTFTAGTSQLLYGFGQGIGSTASDKTRMETYQFFANVITNSEAGDTIRAIISENINSGTLAATGINQTNDPQPIQALAQAQSQGITISTYLLRNQ